MARTRTNRLPRWAVAAGGLLATAGFWVAVTGGTPPAQNTGAAAPSLQAVEGVARLRADEDRRPVWHRDDDDEWEERSRITRAPRSFAPTSPQAAPAQSAPSQIAAAPRLRTRGS
jgi:hypothetical protein